jgi:hypothetical protein
MFFCEKCRYLFNITKDIKSRQIGGKINTSLTVVFNKFASNEKIEGKDLGKLKGTDLIEDERFDKLNKKDQKKLTSIVKAINKNFFDEDDDKSEEKKLASNVAFFICKFCKNHKPIKPGTLIYSKNYNTATIETEDYAYTIYDNTLERTRNYICPNPKCASHSDDSTKEAVLTKNATDQVVHVCCVCSTNWTNTV